MVLTENLFDGSELAPHFLDTNAEVANCYDKHSKRRPIVKLCSNHLFRLRICVAHH